MPPILSTPIKMKGGGEELHVKTSLGRNTFLQDQKEILVTSGVAIFKQLHFAMWLLL